MTDSTMIHPDRLAKPESGTYCVGDIAGLLQCSVRHVWRLHDGGKMPPCVRAGRLVRWQKAVIDDWIADGCPTQTQTGRRERAR